MYCSSSRDDEGKDQVRHTDFPLPPLATAVGRKYARSADVQSQGFPPQDSLVSFTQMTVTADIAERHRVPYIRFVVLLRYENFHCFVLRRLGLPGGCTRLSDGAGLFVVHATSLFLPKVRFKLQN